MRLRTFVCFALAVAPRVHAQAQIDTTRTIITAVGSARVSVAPDRAVLTILVEPQAMSVDEATRSLANAERTVLDTLFKLGLPRGAVQVYNNGVAPYRNQMNPMQQSASFAGREIIRVELPRIDQVAAVASAAMAKGATFVAPPSYSVSASDSVRRSLVPQAFQQARRDAEVLARVSGGQLGRQLDASITQGPIFPSDAQSVFVSNSIYDSGQRALPSSSITVNVTARWLLVR